MHALIGRPVVAVAASNVDAVVIVDAVIMDAAVVGAAQGGVVPMGV